MTDSIPSRVTGTECCSSHAPSGTQAGRRTSASDLSARSRPSVLRSVRAYCLWCCAGRPGEVHDCPSLGCSLWPYRFGHNPLHSSKGPAAGLKVPDGMTAVHAIAIRCSECFECAPRSCPCPECPLHPLRPKGRVRSGYGSRGRISDMREAAVPPCTTDTSQTPDRLRGTVLERQESLEQPLGLRERS